MDRRTFLTSMAATGAFGLTSACSRGNNTVSGNLLDVASAYPDLTTFVSLVQTAQLSSTLQSGAVFTVFAPTNAAFAALPPGTLESLRQPQNRETLVRILGYHALPRVAPSSQFRGQQLNLVTAEGQSIRVDGTRGLRVNDANVVLADISAANGLIHVVDTVLVP